MKSATQILEIPSIINDENDLLLMRDDPSAIQSLAFDAKAGVLIETTASGVARLRCGPVAQRRLTERRVRDVLVANAADPKCGVVLRLPPGQQIWLPSA